MTDKFKVVREIETPITGEIDVTHFAMPKGVREFIPVVIETVLEIEGPCDKLPDAITLNGARFVPETDPPA